MANIGIFGIGAIGSLITKNIIRNQANKYFFFNRSEKKSITIQFEETEAIIVIDVSAEIEFPLDWLIVCLKEYHVQGALPKLRQLINTDTKLAIFQNGINTSQPYLQFVDPANVIEAIIDCPIQKVDSDKYLQIQKPKIMLSKNTVANEFVCLFHDSEIEFLITKQFRKSQWIKLIESSAIGSIQSYTGKPCSIFQEEKHLNEFKELVKEGMAVANSEGVLLDPELNELLLTKLKAYPGSKGSSMLTDRLMGNELELNAKIGAIVAIAKKNDIKVPFSQLIYNSLVNLE